MVWASLFWIANGLSLSFNALALPLLSLTIILVLCVWDRRAEFIGRLKPWFGLPVMALLGAPWLLAVSAMDGGQPFKDLSWPDLIAALEGAQSMNFKTVPGVFILTLVIGFVPAQYLLGPALAAHWPQRQTPLVRFLIVWLIAPIIALEIFSNKPPLYTVQVAFPAGALLVATAIFRDSGHYSENLKSWPGMAMLNMVMVGVLGPVIVAGVLYITETPLSVWHVLGIALVAALSVVAASAAARRHAVAWFICASAAAFALNLWFVGYMMPSLKNFWTAPQLQAIASRAGACQANAVHVVGFREPSGVLALKGRAELSSSRRAASALKSQPHVLAVIESRRDKGFRNALGADATRLVRRGCIRSINLARACELVFYIYSFERTGAAAQCDLQLSKGCGAVRNIKERKATIQHCG